MSERYNRADRIFILAKALTEKQLTPDSNTYASYIIGVSAANFYRCKDAALEDVETLTSAYKNDKWQSILMGSTSEAPSTLKAEKGAPYTSNKVNVETPTLNDLKTFKLKTPCTPVKTVPPKPHPAEETEPAEYEQALILLALAKRDVFGGVGRVTLAQARYELEDKTLTIDDIQRLINNQIPGIETEKRSGPSLAFFLEGKNVTKNKRAIHIIIPEVAPELIAPKEYCTEPPMEKDVYGEKVTY